jgi:hypothetical protein
MGGNLANGVKIDRRDEQGREALAQYIVRNPFSLEKIKYLPETEIGGHNTDFNVFAYCLIRLPTGAVFLKLAPVLVMCFQLT